MNQVIFQCEDSTEGIFTGVYDAWASRLGHGNVKLEAGTGHEMELFLDKAKAWQRSPRMPTWCA